MKRRITLSIALVLGVVLLSLMSSDSTATAQRIRIQTCNTGVITLGPNEILRMTALSRVNVNTNVQFRKIEGSLGTCDGGVCKLSWINSVEFPTVVLAPGEAAFFDIDGGYFGAHGTATFKFTDIIITNVVINSVTGGVVAIMTPADGCTA